MPELSAVSTAHSNPEAVALDCLQAVLSAANGRQIKAVVIDMDERLIEVWLVELDYRYTVDYITDDLPQGSVVVARRCEYINVELVHQAATVLLRGVPLYRVVCRCCTGLTAVNVCSFCLLVDNHPEACPMLQPDVPKTLDSLHLVAYREWAAGYDARQNSVTPELLAAARKVHEDPATSARWRMGFEKAGWEQM